MSTLPEPLMKLYTNPLIRIFRFLGGISILALLTKTLVHLHPFILYAVFAFSVPYAFFMIYIAYYRIKHMLYILKTDKLEVRNSPLDHFASYAAKLIYCVKGACKAWVSVGFALCVMAGYI